MADGNRIEPDRYEPLPGLVQLPGWLWRKTRMRFRIAAGIALVAAVALAVALAPGIRESKQERARVEQLQEAEQRTRLAEKLRAEQRPRFRRSDSVAPSGAGADRRLAARAGLMHELSGAILADARRRVRRGELDGTIRRVECEPFPRSIRAVGADRDLARRSGGYSCVAVTSEFERSAAGAGGIIGHEFRVRADFESGRYAFCKISGQAGPSREQLATVPRSCGGS